MNQAARRRHRIAAPIALLLGAVAILPAQEPAKADADPFGLTPGFEEVEEPPLLTRKFLVPEGMWSEAWLIKRSKEQLAEDIENDNVDFFDGRIPDFDAKPPTVEDYMQSVGVRFPDGASATLEVDPSLHYDRLVAVNSEDGLELVRLLVQIEAGAHAVAKLRLLRQLELTKALRKDPRNLAGIDLTEFDEPPRIEFLRNAGADAIREATGQFHAGEPKTYWQKVDAFLMKNRRNSLAAQIIAIENALREELDLWQRQLESDQRRVALLQREIEKLIEPAKD